MHILSSRNRSEFLATPQLIRFDYVRGQHTFEPTLLVKGSTLILKYIALGARIQLGFAPLGDRLIYGLKVYDNDDKAALLWSAVERSREKRAIAALARGETCQTFLFNELAVNVAWAALPISANSQLAAMVDRATLGPVDYEIIKGNASPTLDRFHTTSDAATDFISTELPQPIEWHPIKSHFITSHLTNSLIDLFHNDEGSQQEQLGIWLTDNLNPFSAHHSPQIPKGKGHRELTDILLSHQYGSILIESKTLTILTREKLPNRSKLARDVSAHIKKAIDQLRGGIRKLKDGAIVTSKKGDKIVVERTSPMHAIVLIPDLDLIENRESYGHLFIKEFMSATNSFLHLLDVAELLRIVQAAEMIAERNQETTPMMAFDYYLIERFKRAVEANTLCIEVLLRFANE